MEKEPFPVIESERLILKPHLDNKEYAELLYNKIMDSKDHLFRFLPKLWKLKSVDDEMSFLTHSKEEWEKMVTANYAIYLKSTNEVVGTLGVMDISYDNDNAEIGYMLFKDHVHKGYMVEAVKAAESAFFKRGMNKIKIRLLRLLIFLRSHLKSKAALLMSDWEQSNMLALVSMSCRMPYLV